MSGAPQLAALLLDAAARGQNLQPAFEECADEFSRHVSDVWASDGGAAGGWAPLKITTIRRRQRTGRGTAPLHYATGDGGRILASLTDPGSPWHKRRILPDELELRSTLGIGGVHHTGRTGTVYDNSGRIRKFQVPERRAFDVQHLDRTWKRILTDHVRTGGQGWL